MRLGERRQVTGITMRVGGVTEVISVTSRPEIAPLDSGEKSARLTSEQIQNVPMVGRAPRSCLKLLPGMTPHLGQHQQQPRLQRRDHRHQRQRRRRQAERDRQLLRQRHPRRRPRHRHRRRARVRPRVQLRHLGEPEPGHGRRVQGAPGQLRRRAREGPDHDRRHQQGAAAATSTGWATCYLRDYRMNSNEWRLNKFSTEPGAENKPKNQFAYPGVQSRRPADHPGHRLQQ